MMLPRSVSEMFCLLYFLLQAALAQPMHPIMSRHVLSRGSISMQSDHADTALQQFAALRDILIILCTQMSINTCMSQIGIDAETVSDTGTDTFAGTGNITAAGTGCMKLPVCGAALRPPPDASLEHPATPSPIPFAATACEQRPPHSAAPCPAHFGHSAPAYGQMLGL